eukprot:357437-Hanusia_phi.AAC.1
MSETETQRAHAPTGLVRREGGDGLSAKTKSLPHRPKLPDLSVAHQPEHTDMTRPGSRGSEEAPHGRDEPVSVSELLENVLNVLSPASEEPTRSTSCHLADYQPVLEGFHVPVLLSLPATQADEVKRRQGRVSLEEMKLRAEVCLKILMFKLVDWRIGSLL